MSRSLHFCAILPRFSVKSWGRKRAHTRMGPSLKNASSSTSPNSVMTYGCAQAQTETLQRGEIPTRSVGGEIACDPSLTFLVAADSAIPVTQASAVSICGRSRSGLAPLF